MSDFIDISLDNYFTNDHRSIIDTDYYNDENNINKLFFNIDFLIHLIANRDIDNIRNLLELDKHNKIIVNLCDKDNESLLHFSIFSNSYELSRLMLKYGADPNKKDLCGQTPIFRIVFANDDKIIGLLLEYGAILDMQDNDGNTPLHIAVISKNYKIIKSLLDYGIDPLIQNHNNLLSLDFAISKINGEILLDEHILEIFNEYIS